MAELEGDFRESGNVNEGIVGLDSAVGSLGELIASDPAYRDSWGSYLTNQYGSKGSGEGGDFGSFARARANAKMLRDLQKQDPLGRALPSLLGGPLGTAANWLGTELSGWLIANGYGTGPNSISGERENAERLSREAEREGGLRLLDRPPDGITINADGSITLPDGTTVPASPTSPGATVPGSVPTNPAAPSVQIPNTIPENLRPGLQSYVEGSNALTDNYNKRSDSLWNSYLDFEKTYFDKYQDVQNDYKANINSIPKMNLKMPGTMGGSVVPLAPKAHSTMYGNQANILKDLITSQGNSALSGMSSRNALNQNAFTTGQTGLTNALMPTSTALDLYKMERQGQLGIDQTNAGKPDKPSTLSTWAPVVGSLLSSNESTGASNLSSLWDFVSGLF